MKEFFSLVAFLISTFSMVLSIKADKKLNKFVSQIPGHDEKRA